MHPQTVGADWGITQELIASLAELVDLNNRLFIVANSKKGARTPDRIIIKRPWEVLKDRRKATPKEITELMGGGTLVPTSPKEGD